MRPAFAAIAAFALVSGLPGVADVAAAHGCAFLAGNREAGVTECTFASGARLFVVWTAGRSVLGILVHDDGMLVCDPDPKGWRCAGAETVRDTAEGTYVCSYAGDHRLCVHRLGGHPSCFEVLLDRVPVRPAACLPRVDRTFDGHQ